MSELSGERPIPNMIQEIPWPQAMQAVKDSAGFDDFAAFRAHLETSLPYNSAYTHERYSRTILKYFFPDSSVNNLPTRVWTAYQDTLIPEDMLRYQLPDQEPTLAQGYAWLCKPGRPLDADLRQETKQALHRGDDVGLFLFIRVDLE